MHNLYFVKFSAFACIKELKLNYKIDEVRIRRHNFAISGLIS